VVVEAMEEDVVEEGEEDNGVGDGVEGPSGSGVGEDEGA